MSAKIEPINGGLEGLLNAARLADLGPVLREAGYDTLEDLLDASEEELVEAGLKKPKARRLIKAASAAAEKTAATSASTLH